MRIFTYTVYDRVHMDALAGQIEQFPDIAPLLTYEEAIERAMELTGRDRGILQYLMPQCERGNRRFFLSANRPQKAALRGGGVIVQRLA